MTRKLRNHHDLCCQSRRKMPGRSMRDDESKKMFKEKPIENTEKKKNEYITPYNMEACQRKKKKKKENEKGKKASVRY